MAGYWFWRAVFRLTSLPWRVERLHSVNYLHQVVVVCRLHRCIWYAPCIMLLRHFQWGHFHTGGGGTLSNFVWRCVCCMLSNVYLWSSEYKKITSKYSIILYIYNVSRNYNTRWLTSYCIVCPSITVFSMPINRRRMYVNTNHNCAFRTFQIS